MILKPRCLAGRSPCDSSTKASSASAEKPSWKVLFLDLNLCHTITLLNDTGKCVQRYVSPHSLTNQVAGFTKPSNSPSIGPHRWDTFEHRHIAKEGAILAGYPQMVQRLAERAKGG